PQFQDAEAAAALAPALAQWQAQRDAMLQRTQALLRPGGLDGEDGLRLQTLHAEVSTAQAAAQHLQGRLQAVVQSRQEAMRRESQWSLAGLLVLLGLASIAVVEPSARAAGQRMRHLADRAAEMQRLALVAERTTAIVMITDAEDRVQWVNAAFERVTGWKPHEAMGSQVHVLLQHPREDAAVRHNLLQALAHGQGLNYEWLRRRRDGRDIWLNVDLRPVQDEAGNLTGFVRVATDVTARMQQQGKLQALWAALPAGVVVQSEAGAIVDGNRAAERLLGLSLAQMQDMDSMDGRWRAVREDGSDYPISEQPAMRTLRSGEPLFNQTVGVHTPQGQLRWLLVNTEPQRDLQGGVCGVITCFTDITESRLLQQQLRANARTDTLTQLPNRSVVMERLQRAISHARRHAGYGFAILFMDFDRFKQVNDTLGHAAGDELLRQIAERLQHALRPGDTVVRMDLHSHVAARIGGDEFVVVLDGVVDAPAVSAIADRLLADLSQPYVLGTSPVQSTASIGVVVYRADASDTLAAAEAGPGHLEALAETLLRNADVAMYEAKRAGRGRWVQFDDSMHERVVRATAMENDLRRALQDDDLFVVYQPVVDLQSRRMVGVEALVRWMHPERGMVPPGDFIGLAEECGLIDAVGEAVLRKACRQFVHWQQVLGALAPRQLAVNLSRAQLKRPALVDDLRAILAETRMPVENLQLEVTESLAAQDERVQATLRELKNLGAKLALDDFGTGYSSLACLHLMPVDTVKVDRSFVRHAETVEYHRVLIEATIRVARTLGMTTVAEGIETDGQAALMQALDCDRGQGF
ncbi:MAG TPA: EAL domain-containing protein, partial [Rubrivivax sp.]|nr:EAL domain-containing protein [Rubrivivax sp.]